MQPVEIADLKRVKALKATTDANPDDWGAWLELAFMMYEKIREPAAAIEILKDVIARNPECLDARYWLARCYFREYSEYQEARRVLQEALKLDPSRADCLTLLAVLNVEQGRDVDETIEVLQNALASAPDWINPRYLLAKLLLKKKDFDESEIEAMKAISYVGRVRSPSHPMDRYYEEAVTGRTWAENQDDLGLLLDEIRQERLNTV